jgi:hypothetical protein
MQNGESAEIAVVGNDGVSAFPSSWAVTLLPAARSFKVPGARIG